MTNYEHWKPIIITDEDEHTTYLTFRKPTIQSYKVINTEACENWLDEEYDPTMALNNCNWMEPINYQYISPAEAWESLMGWQSVAEYLSLTPADGRTVVDEIVAYLDNYTEHVQLHTNPDFLPYGRRQIEEQLVAYIEEEVAWLREHIDHCKQLYQPWSAYAGTLLYKLVHFDDSADDDDAIKYTGYNYNAIGTFLKQHTDATAAEIEELLDVLHEEGWGLDEEEKPITVEGAQEIVAWLREKKSIIASEQARQ